jgi:hypothetical protein
MRFFYADGKPARVEDLFDFEALAPRSAIRGVTAIGDFSGAVRLEAAYKINDQDKRVPFQMFTEAPMRTGDRVFVKGYDLAPWGKTGMPLLRIHGRAMDQTLGHMEDVSKVRDSTPARVDGDAMFSKDPSHLVAQVEFGLYRDGHQTNGSISIDILEAKLREFPKENDDKDDRPEAYMFPPLDIIRSRACEFSTCPVGRHTGAVVRKAAAGDADAEQELAEICRGVVGYNGGKKLTAAEVQRLARATVVYIMEAAGVLSETGEIPAPNVRQPIPGRASMPTPPPEYSQMTAEQFRFLARAMPEKLMKAFGITGGRG